MLASHQELKSNNLENSNNQNFIVFVGTYTGKGSQGIYIYEMDQSTGELNLLGTKNQIDNPSFLTIDTSHRYLYAVHEIANYDGTNYGAISAFEINPKSWNLTLLNTQSSFGAHPCHVTINKAGSHVLLTNYSSGNAALYPVQKDGSLAYASDVVQHQGSSVNPNRQKEAHAHSVTLSSNDSLAFVVDLGLDKIYIYKIEKNGKLSPNNPEFVQTAPGAGPRHFAFHPDNKFAYVINELNSTITVFRYFPQTGELTPIQTLSTLPDNYNGYNSCADIHVSPGGQFLYGSNRGHNSIAIFAIDNKTGHIQLIGHQSTKGKTPRNFAIDPGGFFLLVANQDSDNIVVFAIDKKSGLLEAQEKQISISMPVCIKIITP